MNQSISRRGLLKTTAAAVGAIALSGMNLKKADAVPLSDVKGKWDFQTDVFVIGAGGAGLVAAIAAREAGVEVTVLEKAPVVGGTTAVSGGMVQAAGTEAQKAAGVMNDTPKAHYEYFVQAAEGIADTALLKVMVDSCKDNLEWLARQGLIFEHIISDTTIPPMDTSLLVPRIHMLKGDSGKEPIGTGKHHIRNMYRNAKQMGVKFMLEASVAALIHDPQKGVVGVQVQAEKSKRHGLARKAVIIASGGYDHNREMARSFSPQQLWSLETGLCYAAPTNTGDGIRMAMAVGADLADMGGVIGLVNHGIGIGPLMPGQPVIAGVFVNKYGQRFVNEAAHYAYVMRSVFSQEDHTAWTIFDEKVKKLGGKTLGGDLAKFSNDLAKELADGTFKKAGTLKGLAQAIGVNAEQLQFTMDKYNRDMASGKDTLFNKKIGLQPIDTPPFYAIQVREVSLGTCGGIKINTRTQAIDITGKPIPGLYAAGMTAGGFTGPYYPGSGTALTANVSFGRIAGAQAAAQATRDI
jgi:urocanate reductase